MTCSVSRSAFHRCRPTRLARMNRLGTGSIGVRESFRAWSHRLRGRGVRYVHHDVTTVRTHRANFYRSRVLR